MKKYFIATAILALIPFIASADYSTEISVKMKLNKELEVRVVKGVDLGMIDLSSCPDYGDPKRFFTQVQYHNVYGQLYQDARCHDEKDYEYINLQFLSSPSLGEICTTIPIVDEYDPAIEGELPGYNGVRQPFTYMDDGSNLVPIIFIKGINNYGEYCYDVGAALTLRSLKATYEKLTEINYNMKINLVAE